MATSEYRGVVVRYRSSTTQSLRQIWDETFKKGEKGADTIVTSDSWIQPPNSFCENKTRFFLTDSHHHSCRETLIGALERMRNHGRYTFITNVFPYIRCVAFYDRERNGPLNKEHIATILKLRGSINMGFHWDIEIVTEDGMDIVGLSSRNVEPDLYEMSLILYLFRNPGIIEELLKILGSNFSYSTFMHRLSMELLSHPEWGDAYNPAFHLSVYAYMISTNNRPRNQNVGGPVYYLRTFETSIMNSYLENVYLPLCKEKFGANILNVPGGVGQCSDKSVLLFAELLMESMKKKDEIQEAKKRIREAELVLVPDKPVATAARAVRTPRPRIIHPNDVVAQTVSSVYGGFPGEEVNNGNS